MNTWDASQIKNPGWDHVFAAFLEGAREARANPEAGDEDFRRAADGYTKRVFEEVDPVSEAALRTGCWGSGNAGLLPPVGVIATNALPQRMTERAMDPGEPEDHYARHEGYVEGWNECLEAVVAGVAITDTK